MQVSMKARSLHNISAPGVKSSDPVPDVKYR